MGKSFSEHLGFFYQELRLQSWNLRETLWPQRVARLLLLEKVIFKYQAEIAAALKSDFNKPEVEVLASEILPVIEEIRYTTKNLRKWMKAKKVSAPLLLWGTKSRIQYEPFGVVLIIAPWNYPFHLLLRPLVSAVAAGNAVLLKPSELTPATAAIAEKILGEVFPKNEVCVVNGGISETQAILNLRFDSIFFTGSPGVGRIVMEKAARFLTPVTLELGGKSPAIFDQTANLDRYLRRFLYSKFLNAGQTCVAPDFVYVHEAILPNFIAKAKMILEDFYGESGQSNEFCRIVSAKNFSRLSSLLGQTLAAGAKVEFGGRMEASQLLISPTLVSGVNAQMALMQEEIFGPLLPILTFHEEAEVLRFIQNGEKPLALYIYSEKADFVSRLSRFTSSGAVCVNQIFVHLINPNLPFGGVGMSGSGSYHGEFGFKAFSHAKAVLSQGPLLKWNSIELLFPPYTSFKKKLMNWVLRYLA